MRLKRWLPLAALALICPATGRADVKLPAIFGNNMVVQRGVALPVWGWADPGEEVYVHFEQKTPDGKREEGKAVRADKDGKWLVRMGPFELGDTAVLTIKGLEKKKDAKGKTPPPNQVVCKNVLVGEVWICSGQSNMQWEMYRSTLDPEKSIKEANHPKIRLFQVPRKTTLTPQSNIDTPTGGPGKGSAEIRTRWTECSAASVPNFSAVAYFFGRNLQQNLKVPIGLIDTSYGGTPAEAWTSREALLKDDTLKYYVETLDAARKNYDPEKAKAAYEQALAKWKVAAEEAKKNNKPIPKQPTLAGPPGTGAGTPSGLYNAMIAPLAPFAIKGAIWYQGESNAGKAYEYRTLFPAMIQDWRNQWKQADFPFLFVQLAPFWDGDSNGVRYAELRDAQLHTTKALKNTAMAVITDFGDEKDIHPKQKEPVGVRLAMAARALAYGEKLEYSGPVFNSKKVDGNKVILSFDQIGGGLMAKGDKLTGFTIAGDDGQFVEADAKIEGDSVVVSSPKVENPKDVRYGWKNFMTVNLFNKEGLPATPFKTDDLPYTTVPKKK
jgi:sialate O-acetylesterase